MPKAGDIRWADWAAGAVTRTGVCPSPTLLGHMVSLCVSPCPSPQGLLAGGEEMGWPRSWPASVLLSAATASLEHTLLLCKEKAKSQRGSLAQSVEDRKSP